MSQLLPLEALQQRQAPLETWLELDQAVLDGLPIGISVCDADGHIVRFNRKAAQLWGRAPRLLDPKQRFCGSFRVESLAGAPIAPEHTPMARAVMFGERFENAEARVQNADGRRWVANFNVQPLLGAHDAVIGAVGCFQDVTADYENRLALERERRTFDMAMIASKMGTWRYTIADNICVYDENAQRLYGLTEARFLHDDEGVKGKFHPDDMDLMWARVAEALDPAGEGRYEVEYRVKQLDGSWRWLSAWGLVEFEGEGPDRKAVAIAGASRDLTELKQAEELQRLLVNELNHRVKNTLAVVQAIAGQTIRNATSLSEAGRTLSSRLISLARAHDILTQDNWSGADLNDLVTASIKPHAPIERLQINGEKIWLPPNVALSFALAFHELTTNAIKYGALSNVEGKVSISWRLLGEKPQPQLELEWRETGGPTVGLVERKGFGTQLLERMFGSESAGQVRLTFEGSGLVCVFRVNLSVPNETQALSREAQT